MNSALHPAVNVVKGSLSNSEIEQFYTNGFVGPLTLYSVDEAKVMWKIIRRKLNDRSRAVYKNDTLSGVTNLANYDRHLDIPELFQHVINSNLISKVTSLLGEDVLCWRSEFFSKYPGSEGTDWHQEDTHEHASNRPQLIWTEDSLRYSQLGGSLVVWFALSDCTEENGCLQFIPGTHREMFYDESLTMNYDSDVIGRKEKSGIKRGFFGYDYQDLKKDPNWYPDESRAHSVILKPGQFVMFSSTLIHGSLPNTSSDPKNMRLGLVSRYVPSSVKVYPDTDVLEEYGSAVSLDKFKTVLVSGKDSWQYNKVVKWSDYLQEIS